jgi:glycosyltransferase involved in cell wall biosynthesis
MVPSSVSVVIAAYNRGAKIARTLDSVLAQTCAASEIIVVDDGSTDDTAGWIRTQYPQVIVATFPNGGTSVARNRGAAIARGDVLVFLDHDDEMRPNAIASLLGLFERFPKARAAFADHSLRNLTDGTYYSNHHFEIPSFHRMRRVDTIKQADNARLYGRAMFYALLRGNLLQQPWAIYRDTYTALGGFDATIRFCEDWELFLRVSDRVPLAVSDSVIGNHYLWGGNLVLSEGQHQWHLKVLRQRIAAARWRDPRAWLIVKERLGMYHKAAGDRCWQHDPAQAWRLYLQSFVAWPFDAVVAARCLLWSYSALLHASKGGGRD